MYFIERMELLSSLDTIRVKTVVSHMSFNLVAKLRSKNLQTEVEYKIEDAVFSEKDDPRSKVVRVVLDGKKFFGHRTRAIQRVELIGAIFHKDVKRIEVFQ